VDASTSRAAVSAFAAAVTAAVALELSASAAVSTQGPATRSRSRSTSLFAHSVPVYPCTFAASSSLTWPLAPIAPHLRSRYVPATAPHTTERRWPCLAETGTISQGREDDAANMSVCTGAL